MIFIFYFFLLFYGFEFLWHLISFDLWGSWEWELGDGLFGSVGEMFLSIQTRCIAKSFLNDWVEYDRFDLFFGCGDWFCFRCMVRYVNVICLFFESSVTPMEKSRLVFQMPSVWLLRKLRKGVNIKF